MEPIGLTVGITGLVGLFSVCLDVIGRVDSYKDFGVESRSIIAQFEADKHLLTKWAQDVGIDKDKLKNDYHSYLDNPETNLIVQKILSSIQEIFSSTESTLSNLQPVMEAGPASPPDGILFLHAQKNSEKLKGAISKRSRIGWSLQGKAKFIYQVQQFGALVQRLYSLVPPDGLTGPVNVHRGTIGSDLSSRNDKATWFSNSQRLLIEMEKQIERETRKELDTWLGASWTNNIYDNLLRRRLDGTCDWILSRFAFLDWISSDFPSGTAKILWINGPAGHGKTILCARVVQYLSTMLESPLAYYFCSSDSESQRDPSTIMRSWISQVISHNRDAFELVCGRWDAGDGRRASQTDIFELFKTIVQHISSCTFVVDGLDECAWAEEKWKSNNDDSPIGFFESIKQAVTHTTTRILVLSRDEPDIRYGLYAVLASDINKGLNEYKICPDDVRSDAMSFSRSIVDKKLTNKSETFKHELSQRMVDRCSGMFLWVKMLEEHLRTWKNKKQLEETVDQAPTALDHLYDRNWVKISHLPDREKLRAFSILRWTAFALRPLTILEITEALLLVDDDSCEDLLIDELPDAIDEDYVSSEILGPCGSLLEIQKATPNQDLGLMTIHLAHFSVKQYILCHLPVQGGLLMVNERLRASSETFHNNILAKLCLRYLNFRRVWQEPVELEIGPVKRPFRDYAAGSWNHHPRETGSNYLEVVELTNAFFSSKNGSWESWKKWFDINDDKSKMPESQRQVTSTNPLFYASLLGLRETVIYLLEEVKLGVDHVDEFNRTALQAAALKGQTLIAKLLLEMGADVMVQNNEGWTPLNSASCGGHVELVKLLLEKGADVTVASRTGETPLCSASHSGHAEVVRLLLEKGADVAVTDKVGWTPLNSASYGGHVEVIRLLLEKGANMTVTNKREWTPLNTASYGGHVEVVRLLLDKGADVAITSKDGWTPLNIASYNGHVKIVQLLLDKGADVTIASKGGWTPLNSASHNGHFEVVKLLLEKEEAGVATANKEGWTPLNTASSNGHVEVVRLLLEKGADKTIADKEGWTPLNTASNSGHVKIVQLLLEKGADMTVANKEGWTPLNSASQNGHFEVVKLLLKKGEAGVVTINKKGWTPLNTASSNGHVEVVRLLLEKGADKTIADKEGWTPLNTASNNGYVEVVKLLLEKGRAGVALANRDGFTPLISASYNGHAEVVQLLLDKGAETNWRCPQYGRTALSYASGNGREAVVKLLVAKGGVNRSSKDSIGRTPLSYAARNGHKMTVIALLANECVDPDPKDHYGTTPLSIAARNCHTEAVKLLLASGRVDFNSRDRFGRTPLWWARRTRNADIAQLLLDYAETRDIPVYENETPTEVSPTPNDGTSRSCDICTLGILEDNAYYNCGVCNGGDFDICLGCYNIGGACLEAGHKLIQMKDKDESE